MSPPIILTISTGARTVTGPVCRQGNRGPEWLRSHPGKWQSLDSCPGPLDCSLGVHGAPLTRKQGLARKGKVILSLWPQACLQQQCLKVRGATKGRLPAPMRRPGSGGPSQGCSSPQHTVSVSTQRPWFSPTSFLLVILSFHVQRDPLLSPPLPGKKAGFA